MSVEVEIVTSGKIFCAESQVTGKKLFFRLSYRRGGGYFVYHVNDGIKRVGVIVDGDFISDSNETASSFAWLWLNRQALPDSVVISEAHYGISRNAKELMEKARSHEVYPLGGGEFEVVSGSSRRSYLVTDLANGGLQCVCRWSEYHRTDFEPCSHCIAVELWLEQAGNRELVLWASKEDAKRQKRPVRQVGRGLWITSRKAV